MDCVPMEMDANIESMINISSKRLCTCADPVTCQYWESLLNKVREYDEDIFWACVPQCVRCGGCVEPFSTCTLYHSIFKDVPLEDQMNVQKRYDIYNEYRDKKLTLKNKKTQN